MGGRNVKDVAEENGMTSHAVLYEWVRIYRRKGQVGLMGRKERIEAGVYKTKARLKKELPDDPEELKELAARLMAEKAMLEQELEMAKKRPGRIPEKLRPKAKPPSSIAEGKAPPRPAPRGRGATEEFLLLRVARGEAPRQIHPRQSGYQGNIRGKHAHLRVSKDMAFPQEARRARVGEGGSPPNERGGHRGPLREEEAQVFQPHRRDNPPP